MTKTTRSHPEMVGDMSRVTFLARVKTYSLITVSHQKLNMYIYWFSYESSYRRR